MKLLRTWANRLGFAWFFFFFIILGNYIYHGLVEGNSFDKWWEGGWLLVFVWTTAWYQLGLYYGKRSALNDVRDELHS